MKIKTIKYILRAISFLFPIVIIIIGWNPLFHMDPKEYTAIQNIESVLAGMCLIAEGIGIILLFIWAWQRI